MTLYTGGLDFSGPVEEYFISNGKSVVDTCINLTGFALVGGPASQDHAKAVSTLEKLNVPYLCTVPLVFQSFEEWQASELGLHPIQVALQVREVGLARLPWCSFHPDGSVWSSTPVPELLLG